MSRILGRGVVSRGCRATGRIKPWRDFSSHGGGAGPSASSILLKRQLIDAAPWAASHLGRPAELGIELAQLELGGSAPVVAAAWRWESSAGTWEGPGFNRVWQEFWPAARTGVG